MIMFWMAFQYLKLNGRHLKCILHSKSINIYIKKLVKKYLTLKVFNRVFSRLLCYPTNNLQLSRCDFDLIIVIVELGLKAMNKIILSVRKMSVLHLNVIIYIFKHKTSK